MPITLPIRSITIDHIPTAIIAPTIRITTRAMNIIIMKNITGMINGTTITTGTIEELNFMMNKPQKTIAYNVYLRDRHIDTVWFTGYTTQEARKSLIEHDGYNPLIVVTAENSYDNFEHREAWDETCA